MLKDLSEGPRAGFLGLSIHEARCFSMMFLFPFILWLFLPLIFRKQLQRTRDNGGRYPAVWPEFIEGGPLREYPSGKKKKAKWQ